MHLEAIGRIGSDIVAPPESLELSVFLDAGGRAQANRVWGGLACVGEQEVEWFEKELADLKSLRLESLEESGELKGRRVPIGPAKALGRRIRDEGHRSLFWATWCCDPDNATLTRLRTFFSEFLASQRTNPLKLSHAHVDRAFTAMSRYFAHLKPVNQHKVISILEHWTWLADEIGRTGLGRQLRSVQIIVDREDFPEPKVCGILVKEAIAASLQAMGMSYRLTGAWSKEGPTEGAVTVDLAAESHRYAGLQCVDILLQVVQHQLPGAMSTLA